MTWLAETCMLAHGWRRALILLIAGAVGALAMPPLFFLPALLLAFPVWVWCLDGAERRTGWRRALGPAFRIGFFFGLGYFTTALHWIGTAFFVDGGWLLALMPFAVIALAAILSVFWGFASAMAHLLWSDSPWRILALAAALGLAEFARGHLFTGFPFDLLGYALTANEQMMQAASLVGVYGLTVLAALIAMTPALVWPADDRGLSARLAPFFAALAVIAIQLGYGQYRLQSTEVAARDDIRMRLVQPAIDQRTKWQAESREFVLDRLLTLSETRTNPTDPGLLGVTHLIWPESALPFYLSEHPEALARIARLLPPDTILLTGAPREEFSADLAPGENYPAYNAILAINTDGEVVGSYDKTHLVPFGEYLPFEGIWRRLGIKQFVPGSEGWARGERRALFSAPSTPPFLPLICYEAIFSGDLGGDVAGADFMLNLTNDAWFDGSVGPAQHFHHVRLRAVEEGRSLVRLANSGVTALVDPLGRVTASIRPGEVGLIDIAPPLPLERAPLFATLRHWPVLAFLAVAFALLGARKRLARKR